MADSLAIRRIADGPRRLRSLFRREQRYELRYASGERQIVTLRALDSVLNARAAPSDFWSCVRAADAAFANRELGVLIQWPSGRRTESA